MIRAQGGGLRLWAFGVLAGALLASSCGDTREKQALEIAEKVAVQCLLKQDSLGMKFQVGKQYGAVQLEISNASTEDLAIGPDFCVWAQGGEIDTALLTSGDEMTGETDRALAYACFAGMVTGVKGGKVVRITFGPWGQGLNLDPSVTKNYTGSWPEKVPAGGKAAIVQRLMTWPGSEQGWASTPVLSAGDGPGFRILVELGQAARTRIILPMTPQRLSEFIKDASRPETLRKWAITWLASLHEGGKWKAAATMLERGDLDGELREALIRSLATQAPAEALTTVNEVMWDKATPGDLQLTCYYALTWSLHPEAKPLVAAAVKHTNPKLREKAEERLNKAD